MTQLRCVTHLLLWAAALALSLAAPASARAETFPSRPIHLIMPYAPGGIVDFEYVARSMPDGYDLVIMDPAYVINPIMQKSMPYNIFKDLVTVSVVNSSPED